MLCHWNRTLTPILFHPCRVCCGWYIGSGFWRVYKPYSSSGQNDPSRWAVFSKGDTLLDYHFALVKSKETVLELINPEVGPAGV